MPSAAGLGSRAGRQAWQRARLRLLCARYPREHASMCLCQRQRGGEHSAQVQSDVRTGDPCARVSLGRSPGRSWAVASRSATLWHVAGILAAFLSPGNRAPPSHTSSLWLSPHGRQVRPLCRGPESCGCWAPSCPGLMSAAAASSLGRPRDAGQCLCASGVWGNLLAGAVQIPSCCPVPCCPLSTHRVVLPWLWKSRLSGVVCGGSLSADGKAPRCPGESLPCPGSPGAAELCLALSTSTLSNPCWGLVAVRETSSCSQTALGLPGFTSLPAPLTCPFQNSHLDLSPRLRSQSHTIPVASTVPTPASTPAALCLTPAAPSPPAECSCRPLRPTDGVSRAATPE